MVAVRAARSTLVPPSGSVHAIRTTARPFTGDWATGYEPAATPASVFVAGRAVAGEPSRTVAPSGPPSVTEIVLSGAVSTAS
jgi:hypothetical protein